MDTNKYNTLGEELKQTVSDAVRTGNYEKLSDNISNMVNATITTAGQNIRNTGNTLKNAIFSQSAPEQSLYPVVPNALPAGYGMVMMVLGIAGTTVFAASAVVALIIGIIFSSLTASAVLALCALICVFITVKGTRARKLKKRMKRYLLLMSRSSHFKISDLSTAFPLPAKTVIRDLSALIKAGVFPEGYINEKNDIFICSSETYKNYIRSLNIEKEKLSDPETAEQISEMQDVIKKGREHIENIRHANDIIINNVMSDKLDVTEKILDSIFKRLEQCPELVPETRKLMDYYLPITQKLLNAYAELDKQNISAENITKTKTEIEKSIDSINTAFYNLYNDLFLDDKVDIISDISVLNTMFAQEGLNKSDFKDTKG